jgi:hypothetical protein
LEKRRIGRLVEARCQLFFFFHRHGHRTDRR